MSFAALVFLLLVTTSLSASSALAAEDPGSHLLPIQDKANQLFESGKFERAYFIYRNELAPIGDKYAQYMVGYMHLMGMGVEEDAVLASAWYRLAAERGYPEFEAVRNQVIESLDDDGLQLSDLTYVELRKQYSDLILTMRQLRRDFEDLTEPTTGSRLRGRTSRPVMVIDLTDGAGMSGDNYYLRTELRFRTRLDYVTDTLGVERVTGRVTEKKLRELRELVTEYVTRIDDR